MSHTEEEAKTKWCPFARPVFPRPEECGYMPGNRNSAEPGGDQRMPQSMCIASACMSWRWSATLLHVAAIRAFLEAGLRVEASKLIREQVGCGIKESLVIIQSVERGEEVVVPARAGYCGLAGKP